MSQHNVIEPDAPILLTVRQAAAALAVGEDTVYMLVAKNQLPHVRLSERVLRIPRRLLEEWIDSQAVRAS
jgi:excisionase family DNA binding protein